MDEFSNRSPQPSSSVSPSPQEENIGKDDVGGDDNDSSSDTDDEAPIPRHSIDPKLFLHLVVYVLDVVDILILQIT